MMTKVLHLFTVALFLSLLIGCATGKRLSPVKMEGPSGIEGTYTVYLFSTKHYTDLEGYVSVMSAVAILDLEGDGHEFSLDVPEFQYGVVKGLSGHDAVTSALYFLAHEYGTRVGDPVYGRIEVEGKAIGYDVRAPKKSWIYPRDTLSVEYLLGEGGKVKVLIRTTVRGQGVPLY